MIKNKQTGLSRQGLPNWCNGEGLPSHFIILRSEREQKKFIVLVFWFYLLYNATIVEKNLQSPTSITSKQGGPPFCSF